MPVRMSSVTRKWLRWIAVLGTSVLATAGRPVYADTQSGKTQAAGTQASPHPVPSRASASMPVPRGDPNSMLAHEQLVSKARAGRIDLYFLGDSITRRWGCTDPQYAEMLANWRSNFTGWNAGNFGWGADLVQHMLWRVQHGELDGVNPKVIVILAGTNNVGRQPGGPEKVEDIFLGLKTLIETCRQKAPAAQIIVTGILPRDDSRAVRGEIEAINVRLAVYCKDSSLHYLNINDRLASPDGTLLPGMAVDGLHLSTKGYQVWADGLKPILTQLLGPKAAVDLAPPPSGDPKFDHPSQGS